MAQMLLNQVIESQFGDRPAEELTREKALEILKKAVELSACRDICASEEYTLSFIDAEGSSFLQKEKVRINWDISETNCQYYWCSDHFNLLCCLLSYH